MALAGSLGATDEGRPRWTDISFRLTLRGNFDEARMRSLINRDEILKETVKGV